MKDRVFVDSNVIIYLYDGRFPERKLQSRKVLETNQDQLVISTQVMKEVSAVLLKKFDVPVSEIKSLLQVLSVHQVVNTSLSLIERGLDIMTTNSISFWDALILAAAKTAGCSIILTEDLNHGQEILGMKIQNPYV